MNDAPMRADRSTSRVGRIWLDLEPRRETLFLINIGVPILIGVARGEGRGALIGGITGLLLSLADLEGPLARRLRLTLMVAAGIAVGGLLGIWLKSFEAIFWIAFFLAVFAAGFLNQVGKGPHFSLRFGAISFAVVAGLPAIETLDYVYWGLAVMISLASRSADHFINGPLPLRRTLVRRGFIRSMGLGSLFAGLRAGGNHRSLDRHRVGKHSRGVDFGHNLGAHGA